MSQRRASWRRWRRPAPRPPRARRRAAPLRQAFAEKALAEQLIAWQWRLLRAARSADAAALARADAWSAEGARANELEAADFRVEGPLCDMFVEAQKAAAAAYQSELQSYAEQRQWAGEKLQGIGGGGDDWPRRRLEAHTDAAVRRRGGDGGGGADGSGGNADDGPAWSGGDLAWSALVGAVLLLQRRTAAAFCQYQIRRAELLREYAHRVGRWADASKQGLVEAERTYEAGSPAVRDARGAARAAAAAVPVAARAARAAAARAEGVGAAALQLEWLAPRAGAGALVGIGGGAASEVRGGGRDDGGALGCRLTAAGAVLQAAVVGLGRGCHWLTGGRRKS